MTSTRVAIRITGENLDPVFVDPREEFRNIELRIGEPRVGETRTSILQLEEARLLAYTLLSAAQRIEIAGRPRSD